MGRTAIVTGGSRGIGAATARLLAAAGWDIVISYRLDGDAAAAVVASCRQAGMSAAAVQADVASATDINRLFAQADSGPSPLGALVNNAGITGLKARVDELTGERIQRMMAVNVTGTLLCARQAILRMSTRYGGAGGVIVNLSSAAARHGSPGEYVDYAASKGAVDTLTQGMAVEVAQESIRVNAVRPGLIRTDIHAAGGQPDRLARLESVIPMRRPGEPEEVAAAIVWLCSDAASYVTGAIVDVGGGR
ncbi:MAG: SDR family oxidoreductase [Actinomycetota bacterium]|nr:SDR family oxidoreductase [Actinomycetota bacterium]